MGSWLTSAKVLCAWFCIDKKKDSIFQMKVAWSPLGLSHAHILWDNFSSAMFIGYRISAVEHTISYCFWCQELETPQLFVIFIWFRRTENLLKIWLKIDRWLSEKKETKNCSNYTKHTVDANKVCSYWSEKTKKCLLLKCHNKN